MFRVHIMNIWKISGKLLIWTPAWLPQHQRAKKSSSPLRSIDAINKWNCNRIWILNYSGDQSRSRKIERWRLKPSDRQGLGCNWKYGEREEREKEIEAFFVKSNGTDRCSRRAPLLRWLIYCMVYTAEMRFNGRAGFLSGRDVTLHTYGLTSVGSRLN